MASMNEDNNVNKEDPRVKEKDPLIQTYNKTNDGSGDYIDLVTPHRDSIPETTVPAPPPQPPPLLYWVKIGVLVLCFSVLGLVVFNWVGPFFIQKVFIPLINWQEETFTTKQLALIVFASISIFPTILLPSSPSMWFAGVIFGYLYGFLIVMSAAVIGVSLPFLIGSMFHHKIEGWLNKYPISVNQIHSLIIPFGGILTNSHEQFLINLLQPSHKLPQPTAVNPSHQHLHPHLMPPSLINTNRRRIRHTPSRIAAPNGSPDLLSLLLPAAALR